MLLNPYRFGTIGGGGPSGVLDGYATGLWAAYGDKLMVGAWSGYCLRTRRASDNAESDIGFDAGEIDVAALESFAGAGDAFLVKLYDQTGNSRHFEQASSAKQFKLVASGAYLGYALSDGSDDWMQAPNSSGSNSNLSTFLAVDIPSLTATVDVLYEFGDVGGYTAAEVWMYGPTTRWNATLTGAGGIPGGSFIISEYAGTLGTGAVVVAGLFVPSGTNPVDKAKIYKAGVLQTASLTSTSGSVVGLTFAARPHWLAARDASGSSPGIAGFKRIAIYEADKTSDVAAISAAMT